MTITLKICEDGKEWDNLVDRSPHGTIFHTWDFLKLMEKHSRLRIAGRNCCGALHPIVVLKNTSPIGLYPIYFYDSLYVKRIFSPPLKTLITYLGPLLIDYGCLKQSKREENGYELQKCVDQYLSKELGANLIKIRTTPGYTDSRAFSWNGYKVEPLYNYRIDLRKGLDSIREGFDKELRKNIRNTSSRGVEVRDGSREDLYLLYDSIESRYRDQSTMREISREYLHEVFEKFQDRGLRFLVAEREGRYLSGLLLAVYNGTVSAWIGSIKTSIKGLYPNDLLLWESIKWSHDSGFHTFEITWANDMRLCKYKSKYDLEASIYFSCTKMTPLIEFSGSLKKILGLKARNKDERADN